MDIWEKRRRNLKVLMAINNTNATRVALESDLSVNTINKFLNGQTKSMRWETLDKVCKTLGVQNPQVLDADNPFSEAKNELYALIEAMTDEQAEAELKRLTQSFDAK